MLSLDHIFEVEVQCGEQKMMILLDHNTPENVDDIEYTAMMRL